MGTVACGKDQSAAASSPTAVDEDDVSILDLKAQRDQLVGHRKRAERLIAKDEAATRKLVTAGRKQEAMVALRKKKLHEQMALDCVGHVAKLDELIMNVEAARVQRDIVLALKVGVDTLKKVQKEVGSADYVERLMDEHADLTAELRDVDAALCSAGVPIDEEAAREELERLQAEAALEALAATKATAAAPAAAPATAATVAAPVPQASTPQRVPVAA